MILPEVSDSDLNSRTNTSSEKAGSPNTHYPRLGLGVPPSIRTIQQKNTDQLNTFSASRQALEIRKDRSRRNKGLVNDENPDSLFGFIRDLAEETSHWDRSLFMDQNFKLMMQQSRLSLGSSEHRTQSKNRCESFTQYQGHTISQDQSAKIDLSLLGLDIFRSDGETFIPANEDRNLHVAEGADIISLWEADRGGPIGIAC